MKNAEFNQEHVLPKFNLMALRGEKLDRSPNTWYATGITAKGLLQLEEILRMCIRIIFGAPKLYKLVVLLMHVICAG